MRRRFFYRAVLLFLTGAWALSQEAAYGLGSDSVIDTIQKSLPAIVSIHAENVALYQSPAGLAKDPDTGRIVAVKPLHVARYARQGAGVILDKRGTIVTNAHTVENAGRVKVTLRNGKEYVATVGLLIPEDDLAFLTIGPDVTLTSMPLAEAKDITLGSAAYNVGASEVLQGSISQGTIIGVGRKDGDAVELIKVDFDVYRGDSGGPLLNTGGKLLGLIVAGSTRGGRLSIAVPSNKIRKQYQKYLETNP